RRSREFGIHKIHGASSAHIFGDIYIENLTMTSVALFFSWWLIETFETLVSSRLEFNTIQNTQFNIFLSVAILLLLPFITSIYPFLRYSSTPSITSLRSVHVGGSSMVSRKIFLFIQYMITFGLLVISLFFVKQLRFMLDADLGYNTENVMMCTLMSMPLLDQSSPESMRNYAETLRNNEQLINQKMNGSTLFTEWAKGKPLYRSEAIYPVSLA